MDPVYRDLRQYAAMLYDERSTNESRVATYEKIQSCIQQSDPKILIDAALRIIQDVTIAPQDRCLAASIVSDAIRLGRVTCDALPYTGMAMYLSTTRLHPVIVAGISNILAMCALHLWPHSWDTMLDILCPEDLAMHPELCVALEAVTSAVVDIDPATYRRDQYRVLRAAFEAAAPVVLQRVVNAIGVIVTGSVASLYTASDYTGPPVDGVLDQLLTIVEKTIPFASTEQWWTSYVNELVVTLLGQVECPDRMMHACNIFGTLVAVSSAQLSSRGSLWTENTTANSLLLHVVSRIQLLTTVQAWDAVSSILETISELSLDNIRSMAQPIFDAIVFSVLPIPSVKFANIACSLLVSILPIAVAAEVDTVGFLSLLRLRARKFLSHPRTGWDDSAHFSAIEFSTEEDYESAFALLRSAVGNVLTVLCGLVPNTIASFVADELEKLPFPPSNDPRNCYGYIDQRSPTYVEWEIASFFAEQSRTAFASPLTAEAVARCFTVCFRKAKEIADATLVPPLLNILSSLWVSPWAEHWNQSLECLFHFLSIVPAANIQLTDDLDVISARQRAATLLIRVCADFGASIAPLSSTVVRYVQRIIISTGRQVLLPSEIPLLYEAIAALSNVMTSDEQPRFISSLIDSYRDWIVDEARDMSPENLASLLCGSSTDSKDRRRQLRTAVSVLTAVMRRCSAQGPIAKALAAQLGPVFTKFLICFFQVAPFLPKRYAHIFELDLSEKDAIATSGKQRPPTNKDPVVTYAVSIRTNIYGGIAVMMRILQSVPDIFNELCNLLLPSSDRPLMSAYLVKQMCFSCLFEAIGVLPRCALLVLPPLGAYLLAHSQVSRSDRDDVVETKLIASTYRIGASTIKRAIIEPNDGALLKGDPQLAACVAKFYVDVLRSGYETKTATYDALRFCNDPKYPLSQEILLTVLQCAVHPRVDVQVRRFVADKVADMYLKHFPEYVGVFEALGATADDTERLHLSLMSVPRSEAKRRRFVEFVASFFRISL